MQYYSITATASHWPTRQPTIIAGLANARSHVRALIEAREMEALTDLEILGAPEEVQVYAGDVWREARRRADVICPARPTIVTPDHGLIRLERAAAPEVPPRDPEVFDLEPDLSHDPEPAPGPITVAQLLDGLVKDGHRLIGHEEDDEETRHQFETAEEAAEFAQECSSRVLEAICEETGASTVFCVMGYETGPDLVLDYTVTKRNARTQAHFEAILN